MAPKKSKANQENQNPTWEAATNASRSEIATSTGQPSNSNSTSGPSSSVNYHTEATGEVDDSLRLYADGEEPPNHSTTSVISNVSYTKMFIDNPPRRSSTATSQQSNAVAAAQSQFGDSSDSENESSEHFYPQPPPAVQSDATSRHNFLNPIFYYVVNGKTNSTLNQEGFVRCSLNFTSNPCKIYQMVFIPFRDYKSIVAVFILSITENLLVYGSPGCGKTTICVN